MLTSWDEGTDAMELRRLQSNKVVQEAARLVVWLTCWPLSLSGSSGRGRAALPGCRHCGGDYRQPAAVENRSQTRELGTGVTDGWSRTTGAPSLEFLHVAVLKCVSSLCWQMYNFTAFAMQLNELHGNAEETVPRTDCRLRPDIRAMENGDIGKKCCHAREAETA